MALWDRLTAWLRPRADFMSDLRHPTAWLTNWAQGGKTLAGTYVSPDGAMALAAYYACLRAISEDVAKLPLITYRRLKPRGKERAPDHPLYMLLHDFPNPDMESMTFRETLTAHALAWGNGYAEIERDSFGDAIALHPIHPSRVTPRRNDQGAIVYDVSGSELVIGGQWFNVVRLRAENMVHVRGLGAEGLGGYSVARLAAESLGVTLAAQNFGAAFFGNGAFLSGVLEHPGKLSDMAAKHLRESWSEVYAGPANAGKPGILEEGMKWQQLGIPPEQGQFLETRQFQVIEVCRWFRVPPHKIQDLSGAKYANIEQQNLEYVTDTLMPWLTRWEQQLKRKLFGDDVEYFAEHLVLGLLRGDQTARAAYYKTRFDLATLSPDDIRELENENPLPASERGGTMYFLAANNYQPLRFVAQGGNDEPEDIEEAETEAEGLEDRVLIPVVPGHNGTSNGVAH